MRLLPLKPSVGTRAVDTNVIVRYLTADDPAPRSEHSRAPSYRSRISGFTTA